MWRSYFHLLPPLRKLVVNISAGTLSPETTIRVLESGFWQRFLNLLTQSNTPTALLEASSLELHWTGAKHIPPSSEAWRLIRAPFLKFKNVSVFLALSEAFGTPSDDAEQFSRVFGVDWVREMHLSVGSVSSLQTATALQNVASLDILFPDQLCCRDFWTLVGNVSSTLQSLKICKAEHVFLAEPPKKVVMKGLNNMEIAGTSVDLLRGITRGISMPMLKYVKLDFDLSYGYDLMTTRGAYRTTPTLDTDILSVLANAIPSPCFRTCIFKFSGTVREWTQHARNLKPLFSAQVFQIDATVVNNNPVNGAKPKFYGSDLDTAFGAGLARITSFGIRILSDTESDPTRWPDLNFANLSHLTIDMEDFTPKEKWSNYILHTLLDRIQAPLLVSLTYQDASTQQLMGRHVTTLSCIIARFTRLQRVLLKTSAGNLIRSPTIPELAEACRISGIAFSSLAI